MKYYLFLSAILLFSSLMLFCSLQKRHKTLITAHRGASGLAPENTIAAMLKAIEFESDFSELDVQETREGEIILLHDDDLARTTNDSGAIWEKTLADLQDVDAGSWMGAEFAGEPVPLLKSVIDTVRGKMKLNIELKVNPHAQKLAERVVKIVEEKNFINQCILTSFHRPTIERAKALNPKLKVGLIFDKMPIEDIYQTDWHLFSVHRELVDQAFVDKAHQAGKEVHVWTVNDAESMKKLIGYGVDSIITNRPDILREVLTSM